jgi:hypothetical protein
MSDESCASGSNPDRAGEPLPPPDASSIGLRQTMYKGQELHLLSNQHWRGLWQGVAVAWVMYPKRGTEEHAGSTAQNSPLRNCQ